MLTEKQINETKILHEYIFLGECISWWTVFNSLSVGMVAFTHVPYV